MPLRALRFPRATPLSIGIAALLAFSPPTLVAAGTVWAVSACGDTDPGTLRAYVGVPTTQPGDILELGGLPCSTITLAAGGTSITVTQSNLTIRNTGPHAITIDGSALQDGITTGSGSRIFTHTGAGTLSIQHVNLTGGHVNHDAEIAIGGCVDSAGNIDLLDSTVSGCSAYSKTLGAKGGAIAAAGTITLSSSGISSNTANAPAGGAYGGGLYGINLILDYSTLSGNSALGGFGVGGAAYSHGNVTLRHSTISANTSSAAIGGIAAVAAGANANTFYMAQSTVSGNSADGIGGGIAVNSANVHIYNSTIAFNSSVGVSANSELYAPGIALKANASAMNVVLSSNVLSNNTYGAEIEFDLSTANTASHAITFNAAPANNLIRASFVAPSSPLPADTLTGCPLLGPLRDNGGPTRTHALFSGSAAIDKGNNTKGFAEDQRGLVSDTPPLPYPRVSNANADIGAYEVNQSDIVFNSSLEGCPALN